MKKLGKTFQGAQTVTWLFKTCSFESSYSKFSIARDTGLANFKENAVVLSQVLCIQ